MNEVKNIVEAALNHYPDLQAVYLFGSFGTDEEAQTSDVDIALLLPIEKSRTLGSLVMSDLKIELESTLMKSVDLINLRQVNTVFQKEVIMADRRIYAMDEIVADEFEITVLSSYQKLNEERAEILNEISASGRVYNQ